MRARLECAVAVVVTLMGGAALAEEYLPYGVAVPEGETLRAVPEPFSEAVHGRAHENTQPLRNEATLGRMRLPERPELRRKDPPRPTEWPGSGDRGFWINTGQGVYAANDAQTDLVIGDSVVGTTIYAPTHMPAGSSCLETVTAHWRYSGMATTAHAHGFWDHCGFDGATGWQTFEGMDATWKGKYARIYDGEERYWTEVYKDGSGCWHGLLYNFNLGAWEEKVSPTICGSNPSWSVGWTMWESHYLMDVAQQCPSFPRIRGSGVMTFASTGWTFLDSTNSSQLGPYGLCWTNGAYNFQVSVPNNDWTALTP